MSTIQILGLGDEPIILTSGQLHGNRALLVSNPEDVRLDIRPVKRPAGSDEGPVAPVWKSLTGRQLPDTDVPSPTVFSDQVYATLQQALLAFLFRANGGAEDLIRVRSYPLGVNNFPHFVVEDMRRVLEQPLASGATPTPLAVHLLSQEPGPSAMAAFASAMLAAEPRILHCMLLVGVLRPQQGGRGGGPIPVDTPQLRGILLNADRITPGQPANSVIPHEAIEHGWFLCVEGGLLRFAFQGHRGGVVLPAAVVPNMTTVGYRIWRKGQTTYSIAPRMITDPDPEWDTQVCAFLQELGE